VDALLDEELSNSRKSVDEYLADIRRRSDEAFRMLLPQAALAPPAAAHSDASRGEQMRSELLIAEEKRIGDIYHKRAPSRVHSFEPSGLLDAAAAAAPHTDVGLLRQSVQAHQIALAHAQHKSFTLDLFKRYSVDSFKALRANSSRQEAVWRRLAAAAAQHLEPINKKRKFMQLKTYEKLAKLSSSYYSTALANAQLASVNDALAAEIAELTERKRARQQSDAK
jgi:hypothetical protein